MLNIYFRISLLYKLEFQIHFSTNQIQIYPDLWFQKYQSLPTWTHGNSRWDKVTKPFAEFPSAGKFLIICNMELQAEKKVAPTIMYEAKHFFQTKPH